MLSKCYGGKIVLLKGIGIIISFQERLKCKKDWDILAVELN